MTLLQLITALKTDNVKVTVLEGETEIITFYSQGINAVEGDVSARTVNKWDITGAKAITVVLESL